jgi:pyridoxal phosphate enzyme (YggS family)
MSDPMIEPGGSVAAALAAVKARIAAAAAAAGRDPVAIGLVAVSKTVPAAVIEEALAAGHRLFGENRVQEAEAKWPALRARYPDARLHLIGSLQRNKVRRAVRLFDVIETLDREELATALAQAIVDAGVRPELLVQVNTGEEPQKAGVPPRDAEAFVARCRDVHRLPIAGLMCIPPADEEPALHFALLREIAGRCGIAGLSMGMSADFETAIAFDATLVRVGTAIFGARAAAA